AEVAALIARYAAASNAPVRTETAVTSLAQAGDDYRIVTPAGELRARSVVIASGACNMPAVPRLREAVPPLIERCTPLEYGNPSRLPEGGVLIVGASATGVQMADENRRSGRPVVVSVGEHVRRPRLYRGRDVLWWLERCGVWEERYDE